MFCSNDWMVTDPETRRKQANYLWRVAYYSQALQKYHVVIDTNRTRMGLLGNHLLHPPLHAPLTYLPQTSTLNAAPSSCAHVAGSCIGAHNFIIFSNIYILENKFSAYRIPLNRYYTFDCNFIL